MSLRTPAERLAVCLQLLLLVYFVFSESVTITTQYGDIIGSREKGYNVFKGIPYAKPPIGANRWQPPQPMDPWFPAVYNATKFGNACPQGSNTPQDEDCLFINVWTPANTKITEQKPVLLFIHGGAFTGGWSHQEFFLGDYVANSTDTIFVSFNYRIGALGFLAIPGVLHGNYGIMDQMLAMKWVRDTIPHFGGNPNAITLQGQSAGAASVAIHMTTGKELPVDNQVPFQRAILDSTTFGFFFRTAKESIVYSELFAHLLGCKLTNVTCLRQAPVDKIKRVQGEAVVLPIPPTLRNEMPWQPTVDGDLIVDQPLSLIRRGKVLSSVKSIILGTTLNETHSFVHMALSKPLSPVAYDAMIAATFTRHTFDLLKRYPATQHDARFALARLTDDFYFNCPSRSAIRALTQLGIQVYSYKFGHPSIIDPTNPKSAQCSNYNVSCHCSDLPFIFHTAPMCGSKWFSKEEKALSWKMLHLWTSFAKGNSIEDEWPLYDLDKETQVLFVDQSNIIQQYHLQECLMWEQFGYL